MEDGRGDSGILEDFGDGKSADTRLLPGVFSGILSLISAQHCHMEGTGWLMEVTMVCVFILHNESLLHTLPAYSPPQSSCYDACAY